MMIEIVIKKIIWIHLISKLKAEKFRVMQEKIYRKKKRA